MYEDVCSSTSDFLKILEHTHLTSLFICTLGLFSKNVYNFFLKILSKEGPKIVVSNVAKEIWWKYLTSTHAYKKCFVHFVQVTGPVVEQLRVGRFGMTSVCKIPTPAGRKVFGCCCDGGVVVILIKLIR